MDSDEEEIRILDLLDTRRRLTDALVALPYSLLLYLERAVVHSDLGYPDLAAGDAYRALLLTDEVQNEGFEYHDHAFAALRHHDPASLDVLRPRGADGLDVDLDRLELNRDREDDAILRLAEKAAIRCYQILSISLLLCGCLKSANDFCSRGLALVPEDVQLLHARDYIETVAKRRLKVKSIHGISLPDQGLVRREVYPWNDHEPDRFSKETLDLLNAELAPVAPKCVVQATQLPFLDKHREFEAEGLPDTVQQLGIFAKEDIEPGEVVLTEYSILTANNRLKDPLCDACSSALPALDSPQGGPVGCDSCDDILFCTEVCREHAMALYHPAVCDTDTDTISKDPDPAESPHALYLLLLGRALAMASTQEVHPLDLKEVKYIWGDFLPAAANDVPLSAKAGPPPVWTLPFSFSANIASPLHLLEKMDIDIFSSLESYDLWIFNTMYAKFRGTASARVNMRDGRPEVAAVHPLWCLANHDCDPNIQWEWGGEIEMTCREKRVDGRRGGIRKGEEVLNHYCDIELGVKDRREWAMGSLGGTCMCERCQREAELEAADAKVDGAAGE